MNKIQNKNNKIVNYEIDKTSLSCFENKIYILKNTYDELALGYQSYLFIRKAVVLRTIQNSFF